jgi:hypothetical protein
MSHTKHTTRPAGHFEIQRQKVFRVCMRCYEIARQVSLTVPCPYSAHREISAAWEVEAPYVYLLARQQPTPHTGTR